jgi:hypothetical protein
MAGIVMKTTKNLKRTVQSLLRAKQRGVIAIASAVALASCALSAQAANVLTDPGFETPYSGWSAHSAQSWSYGASTALVRTGSQSLWMQGLYLSGSGAYYNMYVYQTIACAAGSTFTADAWFSQYVTDLNSEGGDNGASHSGLFASDGAGEEDGWVEVMFLTSSNTPLADYKSIILTPGIVDTLSTTPGAVTITANGTNLNWIDCQVTNQYDVTTIGGYNASIDPAAGSEVITGTLGAGQNMVAPVGTKYVQFRVAIAQAQYEAGATYWDDCTLNLVGGPAPSVIGNQTPSGSQFFNLGATNFTFTVTSASSGGAPLPTTATNGITVSVNGTDKSSTLQFTGSSTAWNVNLPGLTSNQVYTISVTVSNSAGLTTTSTTTFDTFSPSDFIVEVEDYDYNGGQYIQNPVPTATPATNSYFGRAAIPYIDNFNPNGAQGNNNLGGGTSMCPAYPDRTDSNVAFQVASDIQLPIYAAQSNAAIYNVNLSYNNANFWENYTRKYPAGEYLVYGRISGGGGAGKEYLNELLTGYGTSNFTTTNLGVFILANGIDWGHYYWIPLTDSYGNPVTVTFNGTQQTLQLVSGGAENVIDFMFVPFGGAMLPPSISGLNLPAQTVFASNFTTLTYNVKSLSTTLPTNGIFTYFNGVAAAETFTGNNTNWTVSAPVPQNQLINLTITATDATGASNQFLVSFDTFSQGNFMIEAEDWDFNDGQYIDNPIPTGPNALATNSYYSNPGDPATGLNAAVTGVDYTTPGTDAGETFLYRGNEYCGTEVTSDFLRAKFTNLVAGVASDYDIGWWDAGTWLNYTRTFPSGTYYVYGRLAGGGAFSGMTMSKVTGGWGTTTQTTQLLGTFADPNATGWQTWHWIPLLDASSQMVKVTLSGTNTLKVTSGAGANANYFMFVPAPATLPTVSVTASVVSGTMQVSFPTVSGFKYTVLYANSVNAVTWSTLTTVTGNGSVQTVTDSTAQAERFYKVSVAAQ